MLKIYTLINDFALSTTVDCGGKAVNIVFSGGCKAVRQNGEFCTTDPVLQSAIEGSGGFGKVYRLLKTVKEQKCEAEVVPAEINVRAEVVETESCVSALPVKVCGTVNEAAEWLVELGYRKGEVNTSAKAVSAAREAGYELQFKRGE